MVRMPAALCMGTKGIAGVVSGLSSAGDCLDVRDAEEVVINACTTRELKSVCTPAAVDDCRHG